MKSDMELKQRIEDELRWEPRVDAAGIGVVVEDGVVTLSGYVDSWAEKWGAEQAVKRVAGVAAVASPASRRPRSAEERTATSAPDEKNTSEARSPSAHAAATCASAPSRASALVA